MKIFNFLNEDNVWGYIVKHLLLFFAIIFSYILGFSVFSKLIYMMVETVGGFK